MCSKSVVLWYVRGTRRVFSCKNANVFEYTEDRIHWLHCAEGYLNSSLLFGCGVLKGVQKSRQVWNTILQFHCLIYPGKGIWDLKYQQNRFFFPPQWLYFLLKKKKKVELECLVHLMLMQRIYLQYIRLTLGLFT